MKKLLELLYRESVYRSVIKTYSDKAENFMNENDIHYKVMHEGYSYKFGNFVTYRISTSGSIKPIAKLFDNFIETLYEN